MEQYLLITFTSSNYAMQCESVLKSEGMKAQVIPTPREITLSCGLSILSEIENLERVRELVWGNRIVIKKIYVLEGMGRGKMLKELEM